MEEPATVPWNLSISDPDFEKLKAGLQVRDMDDKWLVTATEQSRNGQIFIHFVRSWTGKELYTLAVTPSVGGGGGGGGSTGGAGNSRRTSGVRIEAITWEQNLSGLRISEDYAKKVVVVVSRNLMGCDFDALPHYEYPRLRRSAA